MITTCSRMTYGRAGTLPSSFSSSLEESQAPLRLKAVVAGLHPLSALGDLGGESSTTYELGVFIDTLEHEASGDLLLLLLSRGLRSSPGWASYSLRQVCRTQKAPAITAKIPQHRISVSIPEWSSEHSLNTVQADCLSHPINTFGNHKLSKYSSSFLSI